MKALALPVVKSIILQNGKEDFLARMADPFWFQSFGAVIGMDWNSSGVTTAVIRALKEAINPASAELGLYICGGKGKESTQTPIELHRIGDKTGMDGLALAKASKLTAKVDNTALQDGFNLYLHSFILSDSGKWSVIQQGMHKSNGKARRYHWHSADVKSFTEEPHSAICGLNEGKILNLVDKEAVPTQEAMLDISKEAPNKVLKGLPHLLVSGSCEVRASDLDLKRLGSMLWLAQETEQTNFEELLMLKGMGPRALQSLALVSEIIHGTPSRFSDPARFSFAHGAKNARPFPVPTKVYDETISRLTTAVESAKIGDKDKLKSIEKLTKLAQRAEKDFTPNGDFDEILKRENRDSHKYGGRSAKGWAKPPNSQLGLFD